ncbi:hypothetical protein K435DRAFT_399970 [Dendrothele bispora CBS 962.96]|uniref:Uncharacterized protein n=1 Tax=Dendrothele bispora (strain CBS 962.96) TaxID=1314807 RepID=A0A4S8L8T9_DENBC|nr:hypothetical protein K435DRAFT_399970 [Dendrothele bispora CBS 962.96]
MVVVVSSLTHDLIAHIALLLYPISVITLIYSSNRIVHSISSFLVPDNVLCTCTKIIYHSRCRLFTLPTFTVFLFSLSFRKSVDYFYFHIFGFFSHFPFSHLKKNLALSESSLLSDFLRRDAQRVLRRKEDQVEESLSHSQFFHDYRARPQRVKDYKLRSREISPYPPIILLVLTLVTGL